MIKFKLLVDKRIKIKEVSNEDERTLKYQRLE
jgi:hypothetical protein